MKQIFTKLLVILLSGITVLSALSGCGSTATSQTDTPPSASVPAETQAPPQEVKGPIEIAPSIESTKDTLVLATDMDPGTMNPYSGGLGPQLTLTVQSIEPLFTYDADGNLVPWLAESYEVQDDLMGVTLKLREGVKFHDGSEFNADALLFTVDRGFSESASLRGMFSVLDHENVKKTGEYEVYMPFTRPSGTIAHNLTNLFVVCPNTYDAERDGGAGLSGTGPWKVINWQAGVSIDFEAFEDYWGGKPAISNFAIRYLTESSVRMVELQNKVVDVNRNAMTEDIISVENGNFPDIKVWRAKSSMAIHYFGFNCSKQPFDEPEVRKAVALALDTAALANTVWQAKGEPAQNLLPSGAWYSATLPESLQYQYDPAAAKEALAAAGYPDGLKIKLVVDGVASRRAVSELLPSMLAQAGITLDITYMETAAFNEWRLTENDEDYDVFLGNIGNLMEPSGAMSALMLSNNMGGATGMFHYGYGKNAEAAAKVDELIKRAQMVVDDAERKAVYQELCEYWEEQCFSKSICYQLDTNLVASNLEGMYFNPNITLNRAYFK